MRLKNDFEGGERATEFLDLDAERGIAAGERWERALNEAASRGDTQTKTGPSCQQ